MLATTLDAPAGLSAQLDKATCGVQGGEGGAAGAGAGGDSLGPHARPHQFPFRPVCPCLSPIQFTLPPFRSPPLPSLPPPWLSCHLDHPSQSPDQVLTPGSGHHVGTKPYRPQAAGSPLTAFYIPPLSKSRPSCLNIHQDLSLLTPPSKACPLASAARYPCCHSACGPLMAPWPMEA